MKNRAGKLAALAMALIMGIITLTGCLEVNGERVAAVIGDNKYPVSEAQLYFYYEQYITEVSMASMVESLFGSMENYWSFASESYSAVVSCRTEAMTLMIQTKILNMEAEKDGITLTEAEQAAVSKTANQMMREQSAIIDASGASKEDLLRFLTENAIANKEYMKLTEDMDTTVDPDEVRRKRVIGLTILPLAGQDEEGNELPTNTDEWKATIEKYSAEILAKLTENQDVEAIAAEYEDNEEVGVTAITEFSMEKPEDYTDGTVTSYKELGWSMSTGETKELVMLNAVDKYVAYVFHCLDDNDEEYAEEATKTLLAERRKEYFTTVYEDVLKKYRKIHVYLEVVNNFSITETLYSAEESYISTY